MSGHLPRGEPGCNSCVRYSDPGWKPMWDAKGCLDGTVYGFCEDERCSGLCEPADRCECSCHDGAEAHR
jgi:hypothetical protein